MGAVEAGAPWWPVAGGVRLRVRLIPKSSRDAVEGLEPTPDGPAVKARVRAVPEDGKANAAVAALVATWIGLPKGRVGVAAGQKSRVKTLQIDGDPDDIGRRIAGLLGTAGATTDTSKRRTK